jgi:hypothetical protein
MLLAVFVNWGPPDVDEVLFYPLVGVVLIGSLFLIARRSSVISYFRRRRGACPQCGYELRGALDVSDLRGDLSRGCPECGWRRQATV